MSGITQDLMGPPLGATHRFLRGKGKRESAGYSGRPPSDGMLAAIDETREFLRDGEWHSRIEVSRIAKAHGCTTAIVLDHAAAAVSDSGLFVCLVEDSTPLLAPDEAN